MADKTQPQDKQDRPSDRARSVAPSPSAGGGRGKGDGDREPKPAGGRDVEHVRAAIHRTYK